MAEFRFVAPNTQRLGGHIYSAAGRKLPFAEEGSCSRERGAVMVGLGQSAMEKPTLRKIRDKAKKGWKIFAIKEAIDLLRERDIPVHYACNMDSGEREIDRTPVHPGITYCLATCCHPKLFDHVLNNGGDVLVYNSACGYTHSTYRPGFTAPVSPGFDAVLPPGFRGKCIPGIEFPISHGETIGLMGRWELQDQEGVAFSPILIERQDNDPTPIRAKNLPVTQGVTVFGQYTLKARDGEISPVTVEGMGEVDVYQSWLGHEWTACGGFTVGNRCLSLCQYLGFPRVIMAGFDFGWREGGQYYAQGVSAQPLGGGYGTDHGEVDGRPWFTRVDLLASAVDVARRIKQGQNITVLGDSLAKSLSKRDEAFLEKVCRTETRRAEKAPALNA